MQRTHDDADTREARRIYCESLLSRYPALTEEELADFKHWFQREASAYETAILSTRDSLAEQYLLFKKEHVDPFTWRDILFGVMFWAVMIGLIAAIPLFGK